jgi:hypothetical protein
MGQFPCPIRLCRAQSNYLPAFPPSRGERIAAIFVVNALVYAWQQDCDRRLINVLAEIYKT